MTVTEYADALDMRLRLARGQVLRPLTGSAVAMAVRELEDAAAPHDLGPLLDHRGLVAANLTAAQVVTRAGELVRRTTRYCARSAPGTRSASSPTRPTACTPRPSCAASASATFRAAMLPSRS